MRYGTEPTRFLHTPGIGHTTYLISNTVEGRALAANTPETSPTLDRQRRARKAVRPLAFAALGAMGFTGGTFMSSLFAASSPPEFAFAGGTVFILCALAAMICNVYSKTGHDLQEHLLHTNRDIAQPLRHLNADHLPLTVRGAPTLVVLSRAADAGNLGAVYTEFAYPGRTHSAEVEAALADFTRP